MPVDFVGSEWRPGKPEPFLQKKAIKTYLAFSPDGHRLAYQSKETGTFEV